MGIGPVPAVQRLFARTGLGWDDIDLIELNEAFAHQVLALLKAWGWSADDSRHERLNVNGSGISLGHPIGVSGAPILATLAHELRRRDLRYGLETMRSAAHTYELQSLMRISYDDFCLKKKH